MFLLVESSQVGSDFAQEYIARTETYEDGWRMCALYFPSWVVPLLQLQATTDEHGNLEAALAMNGRQWAVAMQPIRHKAIRRAGS